MKWIFKYRHLKQQNSTSIRKQIKIKEEVIHLLGLSKKGNFDRKINKADLKGLKNISEIREKYETRVIYWKIKNDPVAKIAS